MSRNPSAFQESDNLSPVLASFFIGCFWIIVFVRVFEIYQLSVNPDNQDPFFLWKGLKYIHEMMTSLHEKYLIVKLTPDETISVWDQVAVFSAEQIRNTSSLILKKSEPRNEKIDSITTTMFKSLKSPSALTTAKASSKAKKSSGILGYSLDRIDRTWEMAVDNTASVISFSLSPVRIARLVTKGAVSSVSRKLFRSLKTN